MHKSTYANLEKKFRNENNFGRIKRTVSNLTKQFHRENVMLISWTNNGSQFQDI